MAKATLAEICSGSGTENKCQFLIISMLFSDSCILIRPGKFWYGGIHYQLRALMSLWLGMLRSIGQRSVSENHHILWLDRYSYIWPISCTDRNLMTSTRDDVYDAWGHMLQVNAGVEMLWCFEKQWKIRYMSCMFCMMIWWMDCSFLTADSVRADLRITACISTGARADRGRSMNIYL